MEASSVPLNFGNLSPLDPPLDRDRRHWKLPARPGGAWLRYMYNIQIEGPPRVQVTAYAEKADSKI
jgi:hypothetical protein